MKELQHEINSANLEDEYSENIDWFEIFRDAYDITEKGDFEGEIIGKPADGKEAEQIVRKLFSAPHKVITAVAIVRESCGIEIVESDTTAVYPKKLTDEQIAEHIKGESWRGKAGAYAIQENGDAFIERIEGSLTNVMGLPMELLQRLLERIID